jgi:GTP-binding protein
MNGPKQMPNVAIIGRPNVGKSALFNRLIGRKIAIVHDQPGITRDRLSAVCSRGAQPFMLWDTGGILGPTDSELTAQVRRGAEEAARHSDVLLFVVDAKDGVTPVDQELGRMLRKSQRPVLLVVNKVDHEKHEGLAFDFDSLGFANSLSISAEHGRGTSELLEEIEAVLPSSSKIPPSLKSYGAAGERPASAEELRRGRRTPNIEHPLALAIVGRPNVGKSSLINSIMQSERSIVSELPGTTRDAIDISYERDGQRFLFIDTAGIRRRAKHSSSAEVFSVMRSERSIRRADFCLLIVDLTTGVTAQDKRIAGLIQNAGKAAIVILNKWDLLKPKHDAREAIKQLVDETRARLFFLDYTPVLVASARSGENVDKLFVLIAKTRRQARARIGTGILNRLLRASFAANPPPLKRGQRLKLFYATQTMGKRDRPVSTPEFILFVNDPRLATDHYSRYLRARIRATQPYSGLPIVLNYRPRNEGRER